MQRCSSTEGLAREVTPGEVHRKLEDLGCGK